MSSADTWQIGVYYEKSRVGIIGRGVNHLVGPMYFEYDERWLATRGAFPISARMPLRRDPYNGNSILPWIENLLPEAMQLRTVGIMLGAAPEDAIAILSQIGRDTAGALSIGQHGVVGPGELRPIAGDRDLERIIDELPRKPFLAGEDGVSMSLAGVQTKIGIAFDGQGRPAIPLNGAPSTHILKPDSASLFGGVQNEALCLTLARRVGLKTPRVTTGKAGARSYFLIERYDRLRQGDSWRRVHQEDFCQALGLPPSAKYESNQTGIKGPSVADMFAVARRHMAAPEILRLVDHVAFNVIACNTDAHAKNYSLMITARGITLAPIYDVMCAAAWDGVTRNLAQKIGGKSRGEHLKRRHWEAFARDCGLNAPRLVQRIGQLCGLVLKEVRAAGAEVEAMPAGGHVLLAKFVESIEARARTIAAGLADTSGADDPAHAVALRAAPVVASTEPSQPRGGRRRSPAEQRDKTSAPAAAAEVDPQSAARKPRRKSTARRQRATPPG